MDQPAPLTGVSVLSVGEARGHGEFVDEITLRQFLDCAADYPDGIKVKADHGSGVTSIVGRLKGFRIDGKQLRADLHLLRNARDRDLIVEMASDMPEDFGLSPTFGGNSELVDGTYRTRCDEILSVDIVDMPAANPTGLFSRKLDTRKNDMDTTEISETVAKAVAEAVAPIASQIEEMQASAATFREEYEADKKAMAEPEEIELTAEEQAELEAADEKAIEEDRKEMQAIVTEAVKAELKTFAAKLGVRELASPAPAEAVSTPAAKTFSQIVKDLVDDGNITKVAAIRKAIASNPKEYAAAMASGELRTI